MGSVMLKAQLGARTFPLDPAWRDIEDILTGDYFGTLDYLPRQSFLPAFIQWVANLDPSVDPPAMDDVDWDHVEILFWPMTFGEEESAEPDVVLVSNRWVIVIEVKLDSGLGHGQPWRKYAVTGSPVYRGSPQAGHFGTRSPLRICPQRLQSVSRSRPEPTNRSKPTNIPIAAIDANTASAKAREIRHV